MENKIKHLEMVESIIERMGSNSFHLKGWTVALVTLVGGFASQGSDKRFFLIALIPLFAFWFLDAFYLQLERKYKILYKNVVETAENQINFNMDTRKIVCDGEDAERICYFNCLFSSTESLFYLIIIGAVVVLALFLIMT